MTTPQIQTQTQSEYSNTKSPITSHQSANHQLLITPDYLGGKDGIAQILNNYYENRIGELGSESDQQTARLLIEEELIAEGKRIGVAAEKVKISAELLDKLLLSRLIRVSNTHLGKVYEISHDTLVEPILKSYEKRKLEEERLQRERELVEERRKRQKAFLFGLLGVLMFIGAAALAYTAYTQSQKALKAEQKAEAANLMAEKNKTAAELAQEAAKVEKEAAECAKEEAKEAQTLADEKEQEAKAAESRAKKEKQNADKAQDAVAVAEKDIEAKKETIVQSFLKEADELFLQLDYEQALEKTNEAADLKVSEKEVVKRLMELAYWHSETHQYAKAKQILQFALQLNPNAEAKNLLQKTASMGDRKALQASLKAMDATHLQFLERRYYPHMIKVEGGQFTMGCDRTLNQECYENEVLHEAIVSDFAIAETETTVFQFALYCRATYERDSLKIEDFLVDSWGKEGIVLNPVVNVNWYDAVQYSNWVSEQKGKDKSLRVTEGEDKGYYGDWQVEIDLKKNGYRLPTEVEWEFAAKGGKQSKGTIYAGSDDIEEVAWYSRNANRSNVVGQKKPNELGLYDMSGNVYEWCFDWFGDYPKDTLIADYFGLESGSRRVLRGGSWHSYSVLCRVASRNSFNPDFRSYYLGFRIAYSL